VIAAIYLDYLTFQGANIIKLSGESLGQKSLAPPFLAPNSSAAITSSGINYGSGSSGIFDDTGSFYVCTRPAT
jgi:hypothetical protein